MDYHFKKITITIVFGFTFCVTLGFLIYGNYIFRFIDSRSMFVSFGLIGSIYFALLRLQTNKVKLIAALLLILAQILITKSFYSPKLISREVILLTSLFLAMSLYNRYVFQNINSILFVRAILLSLFLTIFYSLGTITLAYFFEPDFSDITLTAFTNSKYAALIGISLGVGFDLHEKIVVRSKWNNKYSIDTQTDTEE